MLSTLSTVHVVSPLNLTIRKEIKFRSFYLENSLQKAWDLSFGIIVDFGWVREISAAATPPFFIGPNP